MREDGDEDAAAGGLGASHLGEGAEDGGGDDGAEKCGAVLDNGTEGCDGEERLLGAAHAGEPRDFEDGEPDGLKKKDASAATRMASQLNLTFCMVA